MSYFMRIREYTAADLDALRRMHAAQGFGYPFPDLDSPMFVSKLVLEEDDAEGEAERRRKRCEGKCGGSGRREVAAAIPCGNRRVIELPARNPRITMAILLRLTAETYLLHDPAAGTPRQRWQRFPGAARCRAARRRRARSRRRAGVSPAANRARLRPPPGAPGLDARSVAMLFPANSVMAAAEVMETTDEH